MAEKTDDDQYGPPLVLGTTIDGQEVNHPFAVTEVYVRRDDDIWSLGTMSFIRWINQLLRDLVDIIWPGPDPTLRLCRKSGLESWPLKSPVRDRFFECGQKIRSRIGTLGFSMSGAAVLGVRVEYSFNCESTADSTGCT